jgi:hypothetical protein
MPDLIERAGRVPPDGHVAVSRIDFACASTMRLLSERERRRLTSA